MQKHVDSVYKWFYDMENMCIYISILANLNLLEKVGAPPLFALVNY